MGKRMRYPIWNAKTLTTVLTLVFVLSAGLVFFLGHRSVFVELQITLGVISLSLFAFISIGLYKGIRIKKERLKGPQFESLEMADLPGSYDIPNVKDIDFPDTGDDIVGIIISVVLWILVTVVLLAVLLFLANVVWAVFLVIGFSIYWVFYRALRQAFIKSRACKGNLINSLGYGLFYTILYTGWIYGLTWLSKYVLSGV